MKMLANLLVALVAAAACRLPGARDVPVDHAVRPQDVQPDARVCRAARALLAANQGLYNGFLAAGLIWGLLAQARTPSPSRCSSSVCVIIAGVFGAATAKTTILFVQALPAAVALLAGAGSRAGPSPP